MQQINVLPYPAHYLQLLLQHKVYYLHIYANVLAHVCKATKKNKQQLVLVDYGCGNGLLGIFAKYCGIGTVYLVDISNEFLSAAALLADHLPINIDGFVHGDVNALVSFCQQHKKPDAVAGTDVIEHIYNLDTFFANVKAINPAMVTCFTTASVTANPLKNRQLMRLQYRDEHVGSNAAHAGANNAFAGLPFKEIRERMIIAAYPQIAADYTQQLVLATRGLHKEDILAACKIFLKNKQLPATLTHPTNTCDPVTGSWTERLLTTAEYVDIYHRAGFNFKMYNGFYNQWRGGAKGLILKLANALIMVAGQRVAPYITLVGKGK